MNAPVVARGRARVQYGPELHVPRKGREARQQQNHGASGYARKGSGLYERAGRPDAATRPERDQRRARTVHRTEHGNTADETTQRKSPCGVAKSAVRRT